jgi:hypothetical protein
VTALPPGPAIGPIEQGVPMPRSGNGNGELREQLRALDEKPPADGSQEDHSFITSYTRTAVYRMARKLEIHVNTRKEVGGRIRVWKVRA